MLLFLTERQKVYVEQLERCGAQREGLVEEVKQRHAVALKRIRERHEKGVCGTRLRLKGTLLHYYCVLTVKTIIIIVFYSLYFYYYYNNHNIHSYCIIIIVGGND